AGESSANPPAPRPGSSALCVTPRFATAPTTTTKSVSRDRSNHAEVAARLLELAAVRVGEAERDDRDRHERTQCEDRRRCRQATGDAQEHAAERETRCAAAHLRNTRPRRCLTAKRSGEQLGRVPRDDRERAELSDQDEHE